MNNSENNFLDKNTILAILLVGFGWLAWQSYLAKKYPQMNEKTQTQQQKVTENQNPEQTDKSLKEQDLKELVKSNKVNIEVKDETLSIDNEYTVFNLTNQGLGTFDYQLKKYTERNQSPIKFATQTDTFKNKFFQIYLIGSEKPISFSVSKTKDNEYVGKAILGKMVVEAHMSYSPDAYSMKNLVSVTNPQQDFKGLEIRSAEKIEKYESGSFLIPSYEHQEIFINYGDKKEERTVISSLKEKLEKTINDVSTVAISNQYFSAALTDKSEIIPEAQFVADPQTHIVKLNLIYKISSLKDKFDFQYITYVGPKTQPVLEKADSRLIHVLNFGFFASIGRALLVVLKWFYSIVGNWGFAIILLTLLVRFLVLPFNISSYRSMKKMQKIQPMLQSIRQRYKDDPTSLNRETMQLMKEQKVNPLGGCLPMLLQMPIFFALFQVLGNSIEIYQAPFILWITDLSLKDPFYILPIMMGASLFIQQKITPSTMDPAQAKVMQFMPVIFSLMMVSLPSGLTLYTFISTLFGILQQQFFMRDTKSNNQVKV